MEGIVRLVPFVVLIRCSVIKVIWTRITYKVSCIFGGELNRSE